MMTSPRLLEGFLKSIWTDLEIHCWIMTYLLENMSKLRKMSSRCTTLAFRSRKAIRENTSRRVQKMRTSTAWVCGIARAKIMRRLKKGGKTVKFRSWTRLKCQCEARRKNPKNYDSTNSCLNFEQKHSDSAEKNPSARLTPQNFNA